MEFDLRGFGIDPTMVAAFHDIFDFAEDTEPDRSHHPSRAYVRDTKAMRNTPADIIEYPNSYKFIVDMPGLRSDQVKAQIEDGNVLVVSGERRREKGKHEKEEGVKYLKMERRLGKMLKKFALSEDVNTDAISAVLQDGVLTVTVEKKPPPEPKKLKKIEVKVGSAEVGGGSGSDVAVHGGEGMAAGGGEELQRSEGVTV